VRPVALTGLASIAPEDPEPEYVKINRFNVAAVTLQENNHVVLVYLPTGKVLTHFSVGATSLDRIDVEENRVIELTGAIPSIKREPDAIAWLGDWRLVTANEGDLEGGTRGFSIFAANGHVLFDSGNDVEHLGVKHGHYPEDRAENKGVEPEGVVAQRFGSDEYLFVGSGVRPGPAHGYRAGRLACHPEPQAVRRVHRDGRGRESADQHLPVAAFVRQLPQHRLGISRRGSDRSVEAGA
jgi:hypothetical protein